MLDRVVARVPALLLLFSALLVVPLHADVQTKLVAGAPAAVVLGAYLLAGRRARA